MEEETRRSISNMAEPILELSATSETKSNSPSPVNFKLSDYLNSEDEFMDAFQYLETCGVGKLVDEVSMDVNLDDLLKDIDVKHLLESTGIEAPLAQTLTTPSSPPVLDIEEDVVEPQSEPQFKTVTVRKRKLLSHSVPDRPVPENKKKGVSKKPKKRHKCSIPNCKKTFVKKIDQTRHTREHDMRLHPEKFISY